MSFVCKHDEINNKVYLYIKNLLKDIDINETFKNNNLINDNSFYNLNKSINEDYNYFNFFLEKNIIKINNRRSQNIKCPTKNLINWEIWETIFVF